MHLYKQRQGGMKQQNGFGRWTMARVHHSPKNPPKKNSVSLSAMASFSATSSTKSIPVLSSRSPLFPLFPSAFWVSLPFFPFLHIFHWFCCLGIAIENKQTNQKGGGESRHCDSVCRGSCPLCHSVLREYEEFPGCRWGYDAFDVWSFRFGKGLNFGLEFITLPFEIIRRYLHTHVANGSTPNRE